MYIKLIISTGIDNLSRVDPTLPKQSSKGNRVDIINCSADL